VLVRLPFTRGFSLPDVPLSSTDVVTSIVYLVALVLLLNYTRALRAVWPQAFPRQAQLTPALTGLVYVGALVVGYLALEAPVGVLAGETGLLILQAIAFVMAIVLLTRATVASYRHLPNWFASLRWESHSGATTEIACLHCGGLNPAVNKFCGHCGTSLTSENVSPASASKA